ncbi:MAG: hypothetical protein FI699_02745 [SAR202 cluster bacterium]|nr:hypothetical protein [SAR202 cluster bacterium]|tara:strand:- start:2161 stop:2826 length:666 start_codon:yes stop_codon:yes gene_type:complete
MPSPSNLEKISIIHRSLEMSESNETGSVEYSRFQMWLAVNRSRIFRTLLFVFVVVFVSICAVLWYNDALVLENVGYGGVWVISFIAAGSIIFPLPGPAAVCVGAAPDFGLNPLAIGIISASAEALGEMTGYIAGVSGKSLIQRQRLFPRVQGLVQRRGGLILFIGSMVPNPFFDLIGIAAGSVSYPIKKFLIVVFFAKAIKSISIAYACFMGIEWIQGYIG